MCVWVNNITTLRWWWCCASRCYQHFFKLIMLDFLVCCVLVMRFKWDLLGKRNTSVSSYHPLVSIQRRLNNESRKPFDYPYIAVKKVSNRGYVRRGGGLLLFLLRVVSPVRNPHHPKVSFWSPFSYNDNPKMADLFHGKNISMECFSNMITHRWRTKK